MSVYDRTARQTPPRVHLSFIGTGKLAIILERIRRLERAVLAVPAAMEQDSTGNTDMKRSCKLLLLIFLLVGLVISCSEPPNPRMAELQSYYALKGDGINPPIKRVALKTTGRAGTVPDRSTAPVLSTTTPTLSTNNVPALSTTNVPALSTTNAPATIAPATNAPAPQ